ncbi:MAG TPA: hypothetical protein VLA34_00205, partial [Candidatus Krumholzibacterium sp.]|nr:hypothetical protein [Candidatus Krumholzibacterium sp.]
MSESGCISRLSGMLREEGAPVRTAVILGSGLSIRYRGASKAWPVAYSDIDGLATPGVEGHSGSL